MGVGLFTNLEDHTSYWLDTSDLNVQNSIQKESLNKSSYCKSSFLKSGASVVNISTEDSYVYKLLEFFKNR